MHFVVQLNVAQLPEPARVRLGDGLVQLFLCDRPCQTEGGWAPFALTTCVRRISPIGEGALSEGPGFPPAHVVMWTGRDEYPSYEDLRRTLPSRDPSLPHDVSDRLRDLGLSPCAGEKLLGWPAWIQAREEAPCRRCQRPMEPVLQIDSNRTLPIQLGDDLGIGWLVRCDPCDEMSFIWQCC